MVDFLPPDCPVEWLTAAPLWSEALNDSDQVRFKQPALLRFASDQFMDEVQAAVQAQTLKDYVARAETWEQERVGWLSAEDLSKEKPLRLYHPAHNRFYLVAATLCCHKPGLPDRTLQIDRKEKAGFLLRRRVANTEYGWVPGTGWQAVANPKTALAGEERLPLFPINYADGERKRRVLVGFVPVASRESYQASGALNPVIQPGTQGEPDPRIDRFETRVETALRLLNAAAGNSVSATKAKEISAFIYLDLAEILNDFMKDEVWAWVQNNASVTDLNNAHENPQRVALYQRLTDPVKSGAETWAAALRRTWTDRSHLVDPDEPHPENYWITDLRTASVAAIKTAFVAAVATYDLPQTTDPPTVPKIDPDLKDFYVLRCVYDRPLCKDIHPPLVSDPTAPFQLASFFEPEAPVRPIRIVMPANVSIAGLRKFKKGVSFVVSEKLRSQMERVKGLTMKKLDEGDIPSDPGLTLGKICSFSIPIITLCALILLFIIVQLLNIIFWWIPLLKICFPIKRR